MARHKTKLALTCSGPRRLTKYNPELNEKIIGQCRRDKDHLFDPYIGCIGGNGYGMCSFLEVNTYK